MQRGSTGCVAGGAIVEMASPMAQGGTASVPPYAGLMTRIWFYLLENFLQRLANKDKARRHGRLLPDSTPEGGRKS